MSRSATPAIRLLAEAGIGHVVHAYDLAERHGRRRAERPDYGLEAAAALGIDAARVCKTLVILVDGIALAAVLPSDRQLDLKACATAAGGRRAELAPTSLAERATGSVIGGISPIGSRRPLAVLLDRTATTPPTIYVSAGRRGLQVELVPADLVRATSASIVDISRPDGSVRR
jgi:Cys-tRNA(Pro)/Cys-tRNA(Cys) deacylase